MASHIIPIVPTRKAMPEIDVCWNKYGINMEYGVVLVNIEGEMWV